MKRVNTLNIIEQLIKGTTVEADEVISMKDISVWNDFITRFKQENPEHRYMPTTLTVGQYTNPENILQTLYTCSIREYIANRHWEIVTEASILSDSILETIMHKRDDSGLFGVKRDLLGKFINDELVKHKSLLDFISTSLYSNLQQEINLNMLANVVDVVEDSEQVCMLREDYDCVVQIRDLISTRLYTDTLHIYTGPAGSGKSTAAIKKIGSRSDVIMIALSNTVTLNLYDKYKKEYDKESFPMSVQAYRCAKHKPRGTVLIDEFSQWGLSELRVFKDILKESEDVYILGDLYQMKSFLGRGCLLHAVVETTKHNKMCLHQLNEIKRTANLNLLNMYNQYLTSHNGNVFRDMEVKVRFDILDYTDEEGIYVTGSNNTALLLNTLCLARLCSEASLTSRHDKLQQYVKDITNSKRSTGSYRTQYREDEKEFIYDTIIELAQHGVYAKLISTRTHFLDREAYYDAYRRRDVPEMLKHKIFCNDVATVFSTIGGLKVQLKRGMMVSCRDSKTFWEKFTLNYAITSFKSQGLEWDNVCIINTNPDCPLRTFEGLYVAATRTKMNACIHHGTEWSKDQLYKELKSSTLRNNFGIQLKL